MPLMDNVGLPLREALLMTADSRDKHGLSQRIRLIASGKLLTPAEAAWAFCAGADFVVTARGFMFALGCIQSLKCNKNTCPTGITTHDRRLQKGLHVEEKSVRVKNFIGKMRYGVGLISHSLRRRRAAPLASSPCTGGARHRAVDASKRNVPAPLERTRGRPSQLASSPHVACAGAALDRRSIEAVNLQTVAQVFEQTHLANSDRPVAPPPHRRPVHRLSRAGDPGGPI